MPYEEKKKHINLEGNSLVSIITPLYNAANYISETITSIQKQTYAHWELIIVDDLSTDTSLSLAEAFASTDDRIKVIPSTANRGAAVCRNHATELATGTYIAFLDSDDMWHPQKLEKQLQFMQNNSCDVSYTSYVHMDEVGKPLKKRVIALPSLSYKKQHSNNYVGNLTGIYNASVLGKILAPNIRKRQDWAVWLEAIKRSGKPALGLQEDLAFYRVHPHSMSANKFKLIKHNYNFYRTYAGHSKIASVYYLGLFFWEYFVERPKQIQNL